MDPLVILFGFGVGILIGMILIGSLPGVWIGTQLVDSVPAEALRPALGCVLLGSALGVFTKAGVDLPAWTIVGVPALAGLAAFILHRTLVGRSKASVHAATEVSPA